MMESYSRVRSVKLKRPTPEHPFGFSVRGGHEHGTGIFVSYVDSRSIAHRLGLKVGDQILRVNGYPVSAAVHQECLSLMKIRTSLHLKVRGVGMLPVREKMGDPLTWKLVEDDHHIMQELPENVGVRQIPLMSRMSDTSSQLDSRTEFNGGEAKIYIDTSGQSGLGCCICKGPPERPGIFVQSTKSNGVARESGLRPGDQVLQCNGHSFLNIPFAEAVYYLKSSKHLNLLVLKGAASDLFPGESSGYNSSASSLNEDTQAFATSEFSSPSEIIVEQHEVPKRLSSVTEETLDDKPGVGRRSVPLDRNIEWDEVESTWRRAEKDSVIIEIKGGEKKSGRLRNEEERLAEERRKLEEEQRRLLEEAVRLEEEKRRFEEEKRRTLQKCPSVASSISSSTTESTPSLHGALTQEILKRNERRENNPQKMVDPQGVGNGEKKNLFTTSIDDEKRQQHEQLIEEFKKAHRKMFAHSVEDENGGDKSGLIRDVNERESFRKKRIQKEVEHEKKMVEQRVAGIVRLRQLRIERQHQECQETEREVSKHVIRNNNVTKSPPPPPPLPPSPFEVKNEEIPEPNNDTVNLTIPIGNGSRSSSVISDDPKKLKQQQLKGYTTKIVITDDEEYKAHCHLPSSRPESPTPDYSNSPSPTPESNEPINKQIQRFKFQSPGQIQPKVRHVVKWKL